METAISLRSSGLVSLRRHAARPNWAVRVGPSRVRPFRAEAASPPLEKKTARVVAVGAGVLLTCCLGAAYLHRGARAAQSLGGDTSVKVEMVIGQNNVEMVNVPGDEVDVLWNVLLKRPWENSGDCGRKTLLLGAVYEQMCRDSLPGSREPSPTKLMDLVYERIKRKGYSSLVGMDSVDKIISLLCEEWDQLVGRSEERYTLGCLLTQVLIYQRNYTKANEICETLREVMGECDIRPHLLSATIKMMLAVDKKLRREEEGEKKLGHAKKMGIEDLVNHAMDDLDECKRILLDRPGAPPDESKDDRN